MPILPPVPKVFRLSFQHALSGNNRVFTHLYYQYSGTLSLADAQTLCNTAQSNWGTQMVVIRSTQYQLVNTMLTDLSTTSSPQVINSTTVSGTDAGGAVAAGVAMVVKLKILRRFRGGHARIYLAGFTGPNFFSASLFAAAATNQVLTNIGAFDTAMKTAPPAAVGTLTTCTVSYFTGFTVVTPPGKRARNIPNLRVSPLVDTVVGFGINNKPASQRRRNLQSL